MPSLGRDVLAPRHPHLREERCFIGHDLDNYCFLAILNAPFAFHAMNWIKKCLNRLSMHGCPIIRWEHQIRNEIDMQHHIDYIHYNPVKHGYVKQVKDWPHSSFHRYIKQGTLPQNWGSQYHPEDDIEHGE